MTESQLGIAVIGLLGSMLVALLSAILGVALRERKERANGTDTNGKTHAPRWAEERGAVEWRIKHLETDVQDHEARIKLLERE